MADDITKELIEGTTELMEKFKADLINLLLGERQLQNDSNSVNSLKINVNIGSKYVELKGVPYLYYVVHGRGPGRFPPPDPITGEWKIPYPAAKQIAMFGNKEKYKPVANKYEELISQLIKDVEKKAGEISLAYVNSFLTIKY